MKKIKVHSCIKQEKVVYGLLEPDQAGKCRCKERVTLRKATQMVKDGEAEWTVESRTRGERMEECTLCGGGGDKTCPKCKGVGKTLEAYVEDIHQVGDRVEIIRVSREAIADKKRSYASKNKTPRVATIEASHMNRAYVSNEAREAVAAAERENAGQWDNSGDDNSMIQFSRLRHVTPAARAASAARIEEYGMLILDARTYQGPGRVLMIGIEPSNDQEKGTGRDYDYGRTI